MLYALLKLDMLALAEISAYSPEERLPENKLAVEAKRLLAQFKKSAGGPPKHILSTRTRLSFEKNQDREELRVYKRNSHHCDEHIIIVAGEERGAVQYLKAFLDNSRPPEVYAHSRDAVIKAEEFLRKLKVS